MPLHPDVARLASLGWRLYPAARRRAAKFGGYLDAATADLDTLERWSREYPGCNWGVVPAGSGVWALDVDTPSPDHDADGVAALRALCAMHGPLPPRPYGRSGGGGYLLVFRDAGHPIRAKTGTPAPGLDPKAGRNAFTVAPSRHRRGGRYRWVVAPWELEPPVAPDWLLQALRPPPAPPLPERPFFLTGDRALRRLDRACQAVVCAAPGTRNATLNRQAFAASGLVAAGALDHSTAVHGLYRAGRHAGLPDAECRATIRSGLQAGLRRAFGAGA
jgi:hypothetical protein